MKKTYEKPVLSKRQKLSSVVAATVASNVDL
ncbi:putative RiPP precursor [Mesorhizobium sp.]|nr:putative RiPP precursor [Mesorhizobium sp.]